MRLKMSKPNTKAQSIVEYALMLGVVYMAITGMNLYLKRGVQARVKDLTTKLIAEDLYAQGKHQFAGAGNAQSFSDTRTQSIQSRQATGNITRTALIENTLSGGEAITVPERWEDILP